MSADLLDDLLSGFVGPAAMFRGQPTPAKAANSAKNEDSSDLAGAFEVCEALRIPASGPADSQLSAGVRRTANTPESEQRRHFSQDSQDSQGLPVAAPSQARACKGCAHRTAYRTCAEPVAAGLADVFRIEWPPPGYAVGCAAWAPRAPSPRCSATQSQLTNRSSIEGDHQ